MDSSSRVCFDTNLLIDVLASRPRHNKIIARFIDVKIYACAYSIGTLYYWAKKYEAISNQEFEEFVSDICLIAVDDETIQEAFKIAGNNDLEDAILIAACKQAGIGTFATADKKLTELYGNHLSIELVA